MKAARARPQFGFTLIGIMVTLVVAGILLTLGVPSLTRLIADTKLSSTTNSLIGNLQYARSEAVKRGRGRVAVGPYTTGRSGLIWLASQSWQGGYMVAAVDNASPPNILTGGVLRVVDATELAAFTIAKNGTSPRYFFSPDGSAGGDATLTICDRKNPNNRRGVVVDPVGRIRVSEQGLVCP